MALLVKKLLLFVLILLVFLITGLFLPTTPKSSNSLLFSKYKKDSLLANCPSPRIIFIGGSGLSFGLNSKMVKDSLRINPINTAIQGSIGLNYMLTTVCEYIHPGDIIILAPEYQFFFGRNCYGGEALLHTVFEVSPGTKNKLNYNQWLNISNFLPKYAFSKYKVTDYINAKINHLYTLDAFNEFGDVSAHWDLGKRGCSSYEPIREQFNPRLIRELKSYKSIFESKNASFYITFPALQASSFEILREQIAEVESELVKGGFALLGTAERYIIPDSLIFNAPYHLSKRGLDLRTRLLIEDLRMTGNKQFTHNN